MAEEVEISNVGNGGTVASEETLAKLVAAVEKLARESGKGAGSGSKVQQLYNDSIAKGTAGTKANTNASKANTQATQDSTKSINLLGVAADSLSTLFGQLAGSAVGLSREILMGGDSISDFAQHIPIVGGYLGTLTGFIDNSVNTFRNLSSTGASFGNSINAMLVTAADLQLNLGEMSSLIQQNASSIRLLGGTVNEGVARFTAINRNMKASGDFAALKNMGFTVEEVNEGIADYTALQARLGRLQGQSSAQIANGSANYLEQLDRLAKVTGKSREELEASMAAQASDAGFRAMQNALTGEAADNFRESMALIDTLPADVATGLKDLADGIPQTEEGIALLNTAGPEIRDAMMQVAQGADPQVIIDAMSKAGGDMEKFAGLEGTQRAAFIESLRQSNPTMAAILDSATRLTELGSADMEEARREQARQTAMTNTLTTFDDKIKEVRAALAKAFIESGLLDLIVKGIGHFAEFLQGFGEGLASFVEKISNGEWLSAIVGGLKDALVGLWNNKGIIAAIIAGIGGLMAAKAVVSGIAGAASRGIESRLAGIFGGGSRVADRVTDVASPGTGGSRGGGRNVGRSIGQIGTGAGKALGGLAGGVMKGLAAGFQAFANPAVAIGGAVFAGVVLMIGAAIAGATWLLGKALPTLVEGISSFEDLDGAALKESAVGILAISGALAAFGAGSVVAGLGGIVGGITSGIASLFGGDSPLEKLQEFSKYKFDSKRVENNAAALVAYSKAMAAYGGASAAEGLGSLVGGIARGIVSFFGGDTELPIKEIEDFARYNLPADKVEENARALVAYSNAMMAYSAGSAGSSVLGAVGAVSDAITGFFGGETELPLDKIRDFANISLGDTDRIRGNAEAIAAFGNAMGSLPDNLGGKRTGGVMGAVADFFAGEVVMPYDAIRAFGEEDFGNVDKIKLNAEAVAAFGNAMSDIPEEMPGASVFSSLGSSIASFFGADTPYDQIREFGELNLNVDAIRTNAEAISGMSTAISGMASGESFDPDPMLEYAEAITVLVESLRELNTVLKDNNDGLFQSNASAGELLNGINMSSSGSNSGIEQLNTTMQGMLVALGELKAVNEKVERNTQAITSGNLAEGYVSR